MSEEARFALRGALKELESLREDAGRCSVRLVWGVQVGSDRPDIPTRGVDPSNPSTAMSASGVLAKAADRKRPDNDDPTNTQAGAWGNCR